MTPHPETDDCVPPVPAALKAALHEAGECRRRAFNDLGMAIHWGDNGAPAHVVAQLFSQAVSGEEAANALAPNLLRTCVSALREHGAPIDRKRMTVEEWVEEMHDRLEFISEIDDDVDEETGESDGYNRAAGLALFHLNNAVTAGLADAVLTP